MKRVKSIKLSPIYIEGRKGLKIWLSPSCVEDCIKDKSLIGLSGKELEKALEKPFIVKCHICICIEWQGKKYRWIIGRGYDWNGANVPPGFWLLIGQQKEPRFKIASCVHDYMCEHHEVIGDNRYLSTLVFETLCDYFGRFNAFKRWAMFHSVDNFQKICGRDLERKRWGKKANLKG